MVDVGVWISTHGWNRITSRRADNGKTQADRCELVEGSGGWVLEAR